MLTLGIVLAAVGIVLWIIGFVAHALLIAGDIESDTGSLRIILGPFLVFLGNLSFWIGVVILAILGIIWIVAQVS